jgi:hypothetical protein
MHVDEVFGQNVTLQFLEQPTDPHNRQQHPTKPEALAAAAS